MIYWNGVYFFRLVRLDMRCDEFDEDLLDTIGLDGEEKLTSDILVSVL